MSDFDLESRPSKDGDGYRIFQEALKKLRRERKVRETIDESDPDVIRRRAKARELARSAGGQ